MAIETSGAIGHSIRVFLKELGEESFAGHRRTMLHPVFIPTAIGGEMQQQSWGVPGVMCDWLSPPLVVAVFMYVIIDKHCYLLVEK